MRLRLPAVLTLALLAVLFASEPAAGLTPRLVKDVNTIPTAQSSAPQRFTRVGGLVFFVANDGATGTELWRTDGTVAGTLQLADACPGSCGGNPVVVAQTERLVFFKAFPRGFGLEDLWVTDGSPAGTVRLAGSLLLPGSSRRSLWLARQGVLYFAANDLDDGVELWRSDGTPAGTFQVTDLRPGSAGSEPAELTELDGRLFFRADDGVRGSALWTSDGTAASTRLVVDPLPGSGSHSGPDLLRAAGRALFFVAPSTQRRTGLWHSDGTAGGSSLVTDFAADSQSPLFLDAAALSGRLVFVVLEPGRGQELWASDGTKRGTARLTRFAPTAPFLPLSGANSRLLPEASIGGRMVFRADDGTHGVEPWVTDGTPGGTRLLRDLCPGSCGGALATDDAGVAALPAGDLLLFSGNDGGRGVELWATDGTAAGTRRVRDLCRGSCSGSPTAFNAGQGETFFLAQSGNGARQLWRTDGTSAGTRRLTGFQRNAALEGSPAGIPLGGSFLFSASDDAHGRELWRSDGTAPSTRLLLDVNPEDLGGSFPTGFRAVAGKAWFFADDGTHGFALWASDGTEEGTALVHAFPPESRTTLPPELASGAESAGRYFFVVHLAEPNFSLWRSDGTPGGTVRLSPPELQIAATEPIRAVGGRVYFVAAEAGGEEELWASNGTPEGTRRLADLAPLAPGIAIHRPRSLTVFKDQLFFTSEEAESGRELWRTDGTGAGTVRVKDIDPRPGRGAEPQLLTVHGELLAFVAGEAEHGRELWTSDGTEAGTRLYIDIAPGTEGIVATHLASSGTRLFFSGGPPSLLQGLWVSNGTEAGTRQLSQRTLNIDTRPVGNPIAFNGVFYFPTEGDQLLWRSDGTLEGTGLLHDANGAEIDEPESFQAFAGRLFFGSLGVLFETDGTPEGTAPVLGVAPPFGVFDPTTPTELVTAGGRLLFRRWDRLTGSELWALEDE